MSWRPPTLDPFRHLALVYSSDDEYAGGTLPFIQAGLATGEVVMVAIERSRIDQLRDELGAEAALVRWVDIRRVGANPARIIPLWRQFVAAHADRPVRGIGEPVWPGQTPEHRVEAQRHEVLLNLAFGASPGFSLMCPYDARRLDPEVIEEAQHSHPQVRHDGRERPGQGSLAVEGALETSLRPAPSGAAEVAFDEPSPVLLRRLVDAPIREAGLTARRADDLALALTAAATSLARLGGRLLARCWREQDAVLAEVLSPRRIEDPLLGREWPPTDQGRGLWAANQLSDLSELRASATGTVVRLRVLAGS